jgi:serum/glucocorticoid-regulated kinase 2
MSKEPDTDHLNFAASKSFSTVVTEGERLLWSGEIDKTNFRHTRQSRNFVVTSTRVYNIGGNNFLVNLFSKLIKRSFEISKVNAVTYSALSNNFVLHIPSEYDYFLNTIWKDEFLTCIIRARESLVTDPLHFYMVEEIDLFNFTRYEGQTTNKLPPVIPMPFTSTTFGKMLVEKQAELQKRIEGTETIFSTNNDTVNENSFEILKLLGRGSYGKVFLVEKKDDKQLFALKVINKIDVINKNSFENLKNEKLIMQRVKHPLVVNLEYCFASPSHVFFGMQFKEGGELYRHLRKCGTFSEEATRFYAAQILCALCYLHDNHIMYRDMKPENVLLDGQGNACLVDFGISKVINPKTSTNSYVGTPDYVAPEILTQKGHNKAVDVWCFGILLYEMAIGHVPFYNKNQSLMLRSIIQSDLHFPVNFKHSPQLKDLISQAR